MEKTFTGFLGTNENRYEILWNARRQFLIQNFSHIEDVNQALTSFREVDLSALWGASTIEASSDGNITTYYTGEVVLHRRDPEDAKKLFLTSEAAHQRQTDAILDAIQENTDTIVELGAGYGGNLIRLAQNYQDRTGKSPSESGIKLIMAEYTKTGRDMCAEFLKRKNAPDMSLEFIDHKAPDLSFIKNSENLLIVTVHSIEQVTEIPSNYFEILAQAAPNVHGFHLEPVGFQFETEASKWDQHKKFIEKHGWNKNFAEVIKKAENDGLITIDSVDTHFAAGQPENPSTLIKWHSNS